MITESQFAKVVLIDDDPINNFVTKKLLLKFQPMLNIVEFLDAREALTYLEKESADLIFLDIHMPSMDGWGFLDELKKRKNDIPVLMLSSSIDPNDHQKSIAHSSVKGFLIKPLMN